MFLTYYAFMFAICIRTWIFWDKYTQSFMSHKVVSNKYYFWKTRKYTECWFQRRLKIYNLFISLTKNANLTNFLPYVSNRIFCTSTFDYIKDTFSVLTLFIISNKNIFLYFLTPHQVCIESINERKMPTKNSQKCWRWMYLSFLLSYLTSLAYIK